MYLQPYTRKRLQVCIATSLVYQGIERSPMFCKLWIVDKLQVCICPSEPLVGQGLQTPTVGNDLPLQSGLRQNIPDLIDFQHWSETTSR